MKTNNKLKLNKALLRILKNAEALGDRVQAYGAYGMLMMPLIVALNFVERVTVTLLVAFGTFVGLILLPLRMIIME